MKDYLGNEVQEGDTVCLVAVVKRQQFRFIGVMVGGVTHRTPEPIEPDKPCWEIGDSLLVKRNEHGLCYSVKSGGNTFNYHLSMIEFLLNKYTTVIAIKGISDKEEQYLAYKAQQKETEETGLDITTFDSPIE